MKENTELTVVTTAIANIDKVGAGLAALAKKFTGVVFDVTTTKGMTDAKAARAEIRGPRYEVERIRKDSKAPILALGKRLDSEAARITAELRKLEDPIDQQIVTEENRKEAERQAKVKAEQERQAAIQARIAEFNGCVAMVARHNMKAAEIGEHIEDLEKIAVDESFGNLRDVAQQQKAGALVRLREMQSAAAAREAQEEANRKEREELARQRAEQDERDRVARQAREAEEAAARKKRDEETAAENARLAEERRKFEAEQATARETQRIENERIAAEQRAAQEVIDKANRELEARQQAERESAAAREREADAERQRNFKPTASEMVAVLADHYKRDEQTVDGWLRAAYSERAAA